MHIKLPPRRWKRIWGPIIATLLVSCVYGQEVFNVDNINNSGPGSLRQAILDGNAVASGTAVYIYLVNVQTIKSPDQVEINLTTGELTITRSMIIQAGFSPNYPKVKITNAARNSRLLKLDGYINGEVKLTNLVFENGKASGETTDSHKGGAIYYRQSTPTVSLKLVLDGCEFNGNQAGADPGETTSSSPHGGALYFESVSPTGPLPALEVNGCDFSNNTIRVPEGMGGGAMFIDKAKLTMRDTRITGNTVASYSLFSTAIYLSVKEEEKTLIERCSFLHNYSANGYGSLFIVANKGSAIPGSVLVEIDSCLFAFNEGNRPALGIRGNGTDPFSAIIRNTTFYGNEANIAGAAIETVTNTDVTLIHSTVTRNLNGNVNLSSAVSTSSDTGSLKFQHCVIARNGYKSGLIGLTQSPDVAPPNVGTLSSLGYNRIGSGVGVTAVFNQTSDVYGANNGNTFDPMLAPLADFGGPTLTAPPLPDSPLVDRGPGGTPAIVPFDARGLERPQGFSADIGAVELPRIDYTNWAASIPIPANRGGNQDPDGDGLKNKVEYFLGTSPNTFTKNPVSIVENEEGRFLELVRFAKPRPLYFTKTGLFVSSDLNVWEKLETAPEVTPAAEGYLDYFRYRYPLDGFSGDRNFFRIEVD